jgi:hypothetical protein
VFLPNGIHDAGAKLPACPEKLQNEGERCPKKSQVGAGDAAGYTLGVVEPIKMMLYNGPHASLLTYVVGLDPVSIQVVVQGSVTHPPGGTYGQELSFTIPHSLLEPLPEDPAWLLSLHAKLSGKSGWLRSALPAPRVVPGGPARLRQRPVPGPRRKPRRCVWAIRSRALKPPVNSRPSAAARGARPVGQVAPQRRRGPRAPACPRRP